MSTPASVQNYLENYYNIKTNANIDDFTKIVGDSVNNQLLIDQQAYQNHSSPDVDLLLLLQRDVLSAFDPHSPHCPHKMGALIEEVSHFVYFTFNHLQRRNITTLEMEIQSEVDRVVLAKFCPQRDYKLLKILFSKSYSCSKYEHARQIATRFIAKLSSPFAHKWTEQDRSRLMHFFHSDLSQKIHLSRG